MIRLRSFIKKNNWKTYAFVNNYGLTRGWGNGYVLLPKSHKYFNVDYAHINVDVHGGLTYSELVTEEMQKLWKLPKKTIGMWCVGFDTAHYGDSLKKWPKERVRTETFNLKKQLKKCKVKDLK